jgi:IS30 family transposase
MVSSADTRDAMNETFKAILESLPPKRPRSQLEPYTELIQELRKRGRSFREIAGILAERCGVRVGIHTVYNFVRVRAVTATEVRSMKSAAERSSPVVSSGFTNIAPERDGEVWDRIRALKERPVAARAQGEEKVFHYDENEQLQLICDTKPKT